MGILDQFKAPAGAPGAFVDGNPVGTLVRGKIVSVDAVQAREYVKGGGMGELLYFQDGKPKMQVRIVVDTGVPHPDTTKYEAEVLTHRAIYAKMFYKSDREALFAAVKASGDDDVRVGGDFAARYDGYGKTEDGREAGWKVYTYEYKAPTTLGAFAEPAAQQAPITASTAPQSFQPAGPTVQEAITAPVQQQPPAQAAPAAAGPAFDLPKLVGLIKGGFDDDTIRGFFPDVTAEQIAAARNVAV